MSKKKSVKATPFDDPVIPDMHDWPIYKLHQDRRRFVEQIDAFTMERLLYKYGDSIKDVIAKTIYLERIRIREEPWKVDPPDERLFWKKIQNQLLRPPADATDEYIRANSVELLQRIIHRYSEEIVGTFKIATFLFARRFLTFFFSRLLNTAASRNFRRIFNSRYRLHERIICKGEIEQLRELMKKGTVVIVPTHFSNLDSILIGYAMDAVLGLPSFSYGAGLNLYNTGYTAYYMNRLGAYRVDRRKKNPVYLEALKSMSKLSIERGTNSLFFPGGTRSRSGHLETRLKMGLLGTALEAQRSLCQAGKDQKVFIVPLVLNYHVVFEAKQLIDQHLQRTGKELYFRSSGDWFKLRKILRFAWKFFSQGSEIVLSFGKPMDVLGNFVDNEGNSNDAFGRKIEVRDYFCSDGKVEEDLQREEEYTKMLADRIVERYHKENIVLSSHLMAFVAFRMLRMQNPGLDLYALLRLPADEQLFPIDSVRQFVAAALDYLRTLEAGQQIHLSDKLHLNIDELIADGVSNLGIYHPEVPLLFTKDGNLHTQDIRVLYFYHNRLDHYQLEKAFAGLELSGEKQMDTTSK